MIQSRPIARSFKAAARRTRLRYVSDQEPGIRRVKNGKAFRFTTPKGRLLNSARARIQNLAIPPAWKDVWICPHPNGHLQATGRDAKGRKQYIYHPDWRAVRDETKFHRLARFGRALPRIRRRVARDLRLPGLPREKVVAAVVRLLEQTGIRIGNQEYAEENNSFGLSTLRNHHVAVRGERLKFRFRGKSGKFHEVDLASARLARIVKRCQDLPGHHLFEYVDDAGEIHKVTSEDVNGYLHEIAGEEFSAKDFRTWVGTLHALRILCRPSGNFLRKPTTSALTAMIDEVAEALGNTRAICRKYYIHPAVTDAWRNGTLAHPANGAPAGTGLKSEEAALLHLLKAQNASHKSGF
jgi:DNA topoisomerase-1